MLRIPIPYIFGIKFDVEIVLGAQVNMKQWTLRLPFPEVNVATPPRRNLDDIRFVLKIGPLGLGLIFAHYRGPQQQYRL